MTVGCVPPVYYCGKLITAALQCRGVGTCIVCVGVRACACVDTCVCVCVYVSVCA